MKILSKEDLVRATNDAMALCKNITSITMHPYAYSKIFDDELAILKPPTDAIINGLKINFDYLQGFDTIYFNQNK
jgi:hypothetical protein